MVQAREKVPTELIRKAWLVCGYCPLKDLKEDATSQSIIKYMNMEMGSIIEKIWGNHTMMVWIELANDSDIHPEKGFLIEKKERDEWLQNESEILRFSCFDSSNSSDTHITLADSNESEEE